MFHSNKPILEIQWDSNCYNDQKVVYCLQFKVEKIKSYGNRFLNSFKIFSIFSPPREGKNVIGTITRSDIELKEKQLCLVLPGRIDENIKSGDLLNLSISNKGWCINIEKANPSSN